MTLPFCFCFVSQFPHLLTGWQLWRIDGAGLMLWNSYESTEANQQQVPWANVVTRLNLTKGSVLQGPGECLPKGGTTKYPASEYWSCYYKLDFKRKNLEWFLLKKKKKRMVCYLGCILKSPVELLTNSLRPITSRIFQSGTRYQYC